MQQIIRLEFILPVLLSFITALAIIPVLMKISRKFGLMDKPGFRKLHAKSIPAAGGMGILAGIIAGTVVAGAAGDFLWQQPVLTISSLVLMITGTMDDRRSIRPMYRLMIQMTCSLGLAFAGIRLSSLYGFMGIHELGIVWQYILTVLIITGTTNAFNLIDGIDGLAGGLAFINVVVMGVLSMMADNTGLAILLFIIAAGLLGFLKYNFHPASVFLGNGGALMLGFFMSGTGIYLIEHTSTTNPVQAHTTVVIVAALLIIPVFDSLRVYVSRVRRGESPFKADRTHLHHLFLLFGITHKKAAIFIYLLEIGIVITGFFFSEIAAISLSVLGMIAIFLVVGYLLQVNSQVEEWAGKIKEMENE